MANPFAGAIAYPWHLPEAQLLWEVLVRDIGEKARIDMLFKQAAPGLQPVNLDQAPGAVWKEVLEKIARAGALLALSDDLLRLPGLPEVTRAAQAVQAARPAAERRISRDGRVTIDRGNLRRQLVRLAVDDEPVKVLVVRGDPKSGKSWSRHLFHQAAQERGATMTYIYNGSVASVNGVIDKLFSALQASDRIPRPDESDTTPDAWYSRICNRLAEAAERRGQPLWIAVDDLGPGPDGTTPLLDPDIRSFFNQFVVQLLDPSVYRWFRLLLIHYPEGPLPTKWDYEVFAEDRTNPADVGRDDIAAVLEEWAVGRPRMLQDELRRLVDEVMARGDALVPAGQPGSDMPRLRRLQEQLAATLQQLGGSSG
jgi:hypothetical protein